MRPSTRDAIAVVVLALMMFIIGVYCGRVTEKWKQEAVETKRLPDNVRSEDVGQ